MNDSPATIELLMEKTDRRRALRKMGWGALAMSALSLGAASPSAKAEDTAVLPSLTDLAVLDFALNLEYLEANFYSYATTGAGIDAQGVTVTGRGKAGAVIVPTTTQVTFNNPNVQAYANEIAADEIAHVKYLQSVAKAYGVKPIAQPTIDLLNSFNTAAAAAGLGASFSPFASSSNDLNFLLGAFIFEDVGVTAYHGAILNLLGKPLVTGAGGLLGTEAYHAANIRSEIFKLGASAVSAAQAISNARDALAGEGLDQGVELNNMANIVPADANAVVFARTMRLVLNIVYLKVNATKGGFFPDGVNA